MEDWKMRSEDWKVLEDIGRWTLTPLMEDVIGRLIGRLLEDGHPLYHLTGRKILVEDGHPLYHLTNFLSVPNIVPG
jgi:hypothetical protein